MTSPTSFHLGPRVKYAREKARVTQDALAHALGFNDRQTVSDIENGKRAVKASELAALSEALNQDVEFFLDPFNVAAEAHYAWRVSNDLPSEALDQLEAKANGWVGMLRWLYQQDPEKETDLSFLSLRMNKDTTTLQAQGFGEALARLLQLGIAPASSLPRRVVDRLGIPILFVDASVSPQPHAVSGAACRVEGLSALLVNRQATVGQRNEAIAHALFQALTWDAVSPRRRESNGAEPNPKTMRVQELANAFTGGLLMPKDSLDYFIETTRACDVGHLAEMAAVLQVTAGAFGRRLQALGRIDELPRAALEALQRPDDQATPNLFSLPFTEKLHAALDKGRLSARKAAKTLGMSLSELSALFESHSMRPPFEL